MEDVASYEKLTTDLYVHGSVSLALAMAKETGMVDYLCGVDQPLTSSDVASQLKLKERYVRETLNSLTVAGLLKLEDGTGGKEGKEARFFVAPSCRQMLRKAASNCTIVALNARNYVNVRKIFDLDGPYSVRYQASTFSTMDARVHLRQDIIADALLKAPGLRQRLEQGIRAMDVGCGTGRLSLHQAAMFPNTTFTLSDLMPEPLEVARQQAEKDGLSNVTFKVMDVCRVPDDLACSLDWVMCRNVIHDLPYPSRALGQICKMLKPGGQFSMLDAFVSSHVAENVKSYPVTAAMYADSMFNCIPESYQQLDSEALGNCWGLEKATKMVEAAGMEVLGLTRLEETCRYPGVLLCLKPE